MTKFGELINLKEPVLIFFYRKTVALDMAEVLNKVALKMKKKARVVKIDVEKNGKLSEALKIEAIPTAVIYKNSEMVWRTETDLDTHGLIDRLSQYA